MENGQLEFIWEGSKLGGNSDMLTHILVDGYHPPECYHLDSAECCFSSDNPGQSW